MTAFDELREYFGDENAESFKRLLYGLRALVTVGTVWVLSDTGSSDEEGALEALSGMLNDLRHADFDKAEQILMGLLTIVVGGRVGITPAEWFEEAGLPLMTQEGLDE